MPEADNADIPSGALLTRTKFAMIPAGLLSATARKKGYAFVYLNLCLLGETMEEPVFSVGSIAESCSMTVPYVREAINWLHDNGWITRFSRPGMKSHYWVHFEQQLRQEEAA